MNKPTSVTVFGILNIVFAAFGVFGLLASLFLFFAPPDSPNPVIQIMRENRVYMIWLIISIPLGVLASIALLASGIGLLMLKPWGRTLSIWYAIYIIIISIINTVINFLFLVRPLLEQAREQGGPEAAGAIGGAIGGSCGGCVGIIYPILLLIFMYRPNVIAAFQSAGARTA